MREYDHPLQRIGIQILLFVLSLVVISWPIVAQSTPWSLSNLLGYLFGIWALGVFMLYLISRASHRPSEQDTDSPDSITDPGVESPSQHSNIEDGS